MTSRTTDLHMHALCAPRRAFTLIELLVVIGLITLLIALTVSVSTAVAQKSEVRQIESAMENLESAVQEYETIADRRITFVEAPASDSNANPDLFYDIREDEALDFSTPGPDTPPGADDDFEITHALLEILDRKDASSAILRSINDDLLYSERSSDPDEAHDHLRIRDPWGTELITVFPGREWISADSPDAPDEDETIRTQFEIVFGVATKKQLFFVSAGPDGQFGNLHLDTPEGGLSADDRKDIQRAEDNIYSYDISRKRPQ